MRMDEPTYTTIAENWAHFLMVDMPPDAPEVQRSEMKRAFYAGAASIMLLLVRAVVSEGLTQHQREAAISALRDELSAHVAQGRAKRAN